jgi:recombination protein RecA
MKKTNKPPLTPLLAVLGKLTKGIKEGTFISEAALDAQRYKFLRSGIFELDELISRGKGLPRKAVIEIFGSENAGKSHAMYAAMMQAQARNKINILIDVENRANMQYLLEEIGLKQDKLILIKPQSINEVLDNSMDYCNDPNIGIIGMDSIGSIVTEQEMEGDIGDANIGAQAKTVTRWINRLTKKQTNPDAPTVYGPNQLRDNIGAMFGSNTKTPGGRSWRHQCSVRIAARKGELIKKGDNIIGHMVIFKIEKNSVGRPYGECMVPLYYGFGFDSSDSFISLMDEKKYPKSKLGRTFQLNEKSYCIKDKDLADWIKQNPKQAAKLWDKLHDREKVKLDSVDVPVEVPTEPLLESTGFYPED